MVRLAKCGGRTRREHRSLSGEMLLLPGTRGNDHLGVCRSERHAHREREQAAPLSICPATPPCTASTSRTRWLEFRPSTRCALARCRQSTTLRFRLTKALRFCGRSKQRSLRWCVLKLLSSNTQGESWISSRPDWKKSSQYVQGWESPNGRQCRGCLQTCQQQPIEPRNSA